MFDIHSIANFSLSATVKAEIWTKLAVKRYVLDEFVFVFFYSILFYFILFYTTVFSFRANVGGAKF